LKKTKAKSTPRTTTTDGSTKRTTDTVTQGGTSYEVGVDGALLGKGGASEAGWHSIQDFLHCPKEYQFRHIRKLRIPTQRTPDHFAVGQLFHAARARWFTLGFKQDDKTWQQILRAMREDALANKLPVSLGAEQQATKLIQAFMKFYGTQPKPKVIAAEYKLGPTPLRQGDPFMLWRTARLDDVSIYPEAGNRLCIGESKTTSTSVNDTVKQYTLHGQTMMQALLWKNDPNGEKKYGPIAGIMLDVTVKGGSGAEPSFGRSFVQITDHQLRWFAESLAGYIRAASGVDRNSTVPRNPASCTRLAGRARISCEFTELCRFGSSATAQFVVGEESISLKEWAKRHPTEVAPWL
jgi:hypothetical protein